MNDYDKEILIRLATGAKLEYKQIWSHVWATGSKHGWHEPVNSYRVRGLIKSGLLSKTGELTDKGLEVVDSE